jgi:hypothetical protein
MSTHTIPPIPQPHLFFPYIIRRVLPIYRALLPCSASRFSPRTLFIVILLFGNYRVSEPPPPSRSSSAPTTLPCLTMNMPSCPHYFN